MKEDTAAESPTEVPEASPDANEGGEGSKPSLSASDASRRRSVLLAGGVLLIIAAVLCITLPLTVGKDTSSDSSMNTNTADDMMPIGADPQRQEAFNQMLPLFGEDIIDGYQSQEELEAALAVAFEREASAYIAQENHNFLNYNNNQGGHGMFDDGGAMPMAMAEPMAAAGDVAAESAGGASRPASTADVTDFQTNNQEENVDEADS